MIPSMQSLGIDRLPVEQRLTLVQEIWDSIAAERQSLLTEAQRQELERRANDLDKNPDNLIPWEEVKAKALARFQR
jgi:putative addiction module component (TIGR02574 family)